MFLSIIFILIAISVHEFAHAWMADRLGDPTAKLSGRLTLNPIAHFDPFGILVLIFSQFRFGWGKPVPVDDYNLRRPQRDKALISLAGPTSNFVLAILGSMLLRLFPQTFFVLFQFVAINLSLGLFNLIPLQPLDGAKIVLGFLPLETSEELEKFLDQYSLLLILLLFLPLFSGQSLLNIIFSPILSFFLKLLLPIGIL